MWTFNGSSPIYLQVIDKILIGIAQGKYPPGARLPSVRELALDAGINPNTAQRAYSELERQGYLYTERTNGKFVTNDPALLGNLRKQLSDSYIDELFSKMHDLGYDDDEIQQAFINRRKEKA